MVCEANASRAFDFNTQPISLRLEGGWLKADGTTLGADNGVGARAGGCCRRRRGVLPAAAGLRNVPVCALALPPHTHTPSTPPP